MDGCCLLEREIQSNYKAVLRLMKYVYQPAGRRVRERSELRELAGVAEALGYPRPLSAADGGDGWHSDPAFVACKFGTAVPLTSDCRLFAKSFSTAGVGYTFNAPPFWDVYRRSDSAGAFVEEVVDLADDGREGGGASSSSYKVR